MSLPVDLEPIVGAQKLFDWFGYWPDFHDSEILKFQFELGKPIAFTLHTWEMTNRVDAAGFYETTKHVTVEFRLEGITRLDLQDPWEKSVLLSLGYERIDTGFRLGLTSAYGLCGEIEAEKVSLYVNPGKPSYSLPNSSNTGSRRPRTRRLFPPSVKMTISFDPSLRYSAGT